ncbi:hypothetical protein M9H77_09940 [Catharanthus roseus]|uniref:Uncharacterized protein n=1 Tax=Catharanthus roseus TaxID=4058 RepID=A0ACC0C279_CATRO|nr:hypothetical protein M9H77_09940 [Catharanthus roseus]
MGRSPCCDKVGLKKGPWTPEEDQKLLAYIEQFGHGSWRALPPKAGLRRCGKSCRLRWTNYLRPDIKRGKFSLQEEQTIIQLHALLGNRWSAIASHLPKRTDNEIKNYWNTHLKKRLTKMGIDPMTHKPKNNALDSSQSKDTANLNHMAQWESARLEAEARLVREAKFVIPNPNTVSLTKDSLLSLPPLGKPPLPSLDTLKASERSSWTNINLHFNVRTLLSPTSVLLPPPFPDNIFTSNNNVAITKENHAQFRNIMKEGMELQEIMGSSFPHNQVDDHHHVGLLMNPSLLEGSFKFPHEDLLSDDHQVFNNINGVLYDNINLCSGNLEDKYWSPVL